MAQIPRGSVVRGIKQHRRHEQGQRQIGIENDLWGTRREGEDAPAEGQQRRIRHAYAIGPQRQKRRDQQESDGKLEYDHTLRVPQPAGNVTWGDTRRPGAIADTSSRTAGADCNLAACLLRWGIGANCTENSSPM